MEHNFTWKNDGRTKVMIGCVFCYREQLKSKTGGKNEP